MPNQCWVIREMNPADIDFALECVRSEGWISESRESLANHLRHDPQGCFIAETDSGRVGICVATRYLGNGFIGNLVVSRMMRIFGIGQHLFKRAFEHLVFHGIENIHLDGDLTAVPFYEQQGFRKICRSLRFKGKISGRQHPGVRPLVTADLDAVCNLDRELFGDDRGFFLRSIASQFPRLCFVTESRGGIDGFIMAKPGQGVIAVGPWISGQGDANSRALLEHLVYENGGGAIRVGVLGNNRRAVALIRSLDGLQQTAHSWYMVHGKSDRLGNHPRLWAVGSGAKG